MIKTIVFTLAALTICSCRSGFQTKKSGMKMLSPRFSATIDNKPYSKTKGKLHSSESFSGLFMINGTDIDSIHLSFNDNGELLITFLFGGIQHAREFSGSFSRKGYYEYYLSKKRLEIPPLLPILYSKVHIDRVRIGQTNTGDVIVDVLRENSGNIFILSAGYRYRYQILFKCENRK